MLHDNLQVVFNVIHGNIRFEHMKALAIDWTYQLYSHQLLASIVLLEDVSGVLAIAPIHHISVKVDIGCCRDIRYSGTLTAVRSSLT